MESIQAFLGKVRSHLYRSEGARWALWALVACGALALVLPVTARVLVGARTTALAILAIGGLAGAIAIAAAVTLGAIVPRKRWGSDVHVAKWVGGRRKEIASDLLSAVELTTKSGRGRIGRGVPSQDLIEALVGETATRVREVRTEALVPREPVRQAAWALAAIVVVNGAMIAAAPALVADGWHRLLAKPARPFDGASLSAVPLVGDIELRLTFPAYTARPSATLPSTSGDFRALPGTTVAITTTALEPAAQAEIVVEPTNGAPAQTLPMTIDGTTLRGAITVGGEARYRFQLEDALHKKVIEATPHQIELEQDQPPQVQLYAPAEELDVTDMKRVELAYVIEDDYGVTSAELVWEAGGDTGKKTITLSSPGTRAQGKLVWDLAEVPLPPGATVAYHLEAKDNDLVRGPNLGRSRTYHLRVFSPRQRHEQTLARQGETAEKLVKNLGGRLTLDADDLAVRDELHKESAEIVVELGTLVAAYGDDQMADKQLPKALDAMRGRIDKLVVAEGKGLDKLPRHPNDPTKVRGAGLRFAGGDRALVAELEDDAITLADWLDREQMEGLLDVADEIAAHQKRLTELMDQYAKTGDPKLKAEIDRELRALDQRLAELAQKRANMAEDVLDQFVHADALQDQRADSCLAEVRRLFQAGQTAEAQAQLAKCNHRLDDATQAMEQALGQLRGDKFSESEKKLDELMNDLADLAQDQRDIAAQSDKLFQRYADRADKLLSDHAKEAQKKLKSAVQKLQERVDEIPESGLTPFAKEELDIVRHRLTDLDKMLDDGDIAEALGMAKQAKQSLDTIAAELEAAIDDDPKSPWVGQTEDALDATERSLPPAKKLVDDLQALAPSPDQILSPDDRKDLDKLRRRQQANKDRAQRLVDRSKAMTPDLPGTAGEEIAQKVDQAKQKMGVAETRMGERDPSGAREEARAAADALDKARDRAKGAARQQQSEGQTGLRDEPIRIPGADEYRAPEKFREDILEAMKKRAPTGYDELVKRYYQELIR
ncbi:MAG TPA: DUF4175 family protein [Kofleriaceae bacterium]|nr:DUF4175 family protein [Kofleriaceae bacterium]